MTPALAVGPLSDADWPAMTLLLLPPAGVLALVAGNRPTSASTAQPSTTWNIGWLARNLDLAVVAPVVLGTTLLPQSSTDRLSTLADTGFFRLRLWQSAWAMLDDHPWLGVGLDNFLYQYRTHYILPDAWEEPNLSHPHNILLDFGMRLGVGGLVVLAWLQVAFWLAAWTLYRRLTQAADKALILCLMGSKIATLAHGLVDRSFFLVDLAFIFALALGGVRRLSD